MSFDLTTCNFSQNIQADKCFTSLVNFQFACFPQNILSRWNDSFTKYYTRSHPRMSYPSELSCYCKKRTTAQHGMRDMCFDLLEQEKGNSISSHYCIPTAHTGKKNRQSPMIFRCICRSRLTCSELRRHCGNRSDWGC